jgi:hypothetical protein
MNNPMSPEQEKENHPASNLETTTITPHMEIGINIASMSLEILGHEICSSMPIATTMRS